MIADAIKQAQQEHGLKPVKETVHGVERLYTPSRARDIDGKEATSWQLEPLEAPHKLPEPLIVSTLTAVLDYVKANVDPSLVPAMDGAAAQGRALIVHVKGADIVEVRSPILPGAFAQRATLVTAKVESVLDANFSLATWIPYEKFMIGLQARFLSGGDRDKLLQFLGSVRQEDVGEASDSGYSQTAVVRQGVHVVAPEAANVPNPVTLAPYRTFREIGQPASLFTFRLQKGEDGSGKPRMSLHEADGGTWTVEAISRCKRFLDEGLAGIEGVTILA